MLTESIYPYTVIILLYVTELPYIAVPSVSHCMAAMNRTMVQEEVGMHSVMSTILLTCLHTLQSKDETHTNNIHDLIAINNYIIIIII